MMEEATVGYFMRKSSKTLKLDIDSYKSEKMKLTYILNAKHVAEQCKASLEISTKNGGYHLFLHGLASSHNLRRLLGDDPMRIRSSEIRASLGMPENSDTIFDWKVKYRVIRTKHGRRIISERPVPYQFCDMANVLSLPFCSLGPNSVL